MTVPLFLDYKFHELCGPDLSLSMPPGQCVTHSGFCPKSQSPTMEAMLPAREVFKCKFSQAPIDILCFSFLSFPKDP